MKKNYFKSLLLLLLAIALISCAVTPEPAAAPGKSREELKLTVGTVGESRVELSWNAVQGVDEYIVLISSSVGGKFAYYHILPDTSCTVTGLIPSKQYFFKVAELKGLDNNSELGFALGLTSNIPDATTKAGTLSTPVISASSVTEYSATFSWGEVAGADRYYIYKIGSEWDVLAYRAISDGTTTFTDSNRIEGNTTLRYKVVASNSITGQVSEAGDELVLTTRPASLPSPAISSSPTSYDLGLGVDLAAGQTFLYYFFKSSSDEYSYMVSPESTEIVAMDRYGVMPGKSYHYKLRVFDKAQGKASPTSDIYSVTIPQPELTIVPGNVKLDSLTHSEYSVSDFYDVDLTISWDAATGAEEYFIYEICNGGTADEYARYLDRTTNTTFRTQLLDSMSGATHSIDLRVRAIKHSTKEAGPFSEPLMVQVK